MHSAVSFQFFFLHSIMGWILPNKGFQHNWVEIYFDLVLLLLFTVFNSQVLKMKKTKKQTRTHSYIFWMLESVRMGKSLAFEKQSAFALKWKKKIKKTVECVGQMNAKPDWNVCGLYHSLGLASSLNILCTYYTIIHFHIFHFVSFIVVRLHSLMFSCFIFIILCIYIDRCSFCRHNNNNNNSYEKKTYLL